MTATAEYLTLLGDPPAAWWAALPERPGVEVTREAARSAGLPCWRLTLRGERDAVEALRNDLVRRAWAQGLQLFLV